MNRNVSMMRFTIKTVYYGLGRPPISKTTRLQNLKRGYSVQFNLHIQIMATSLGSLVRPLWTGGTA